MISCRWPIILLLVIPVGCAQRTNPSFSISQHGADAKIAEMAKTPRHADRPIVVIAGFGDVGVGSAFVADQIDKVFEPGSPIMPVSIAFCDSFEACRQHIVEAIDAKFPSSDDRETVPVDIVGISLGGLVARYAADPLPATGKRLKIVRLYTISSPLAGSKLADKVGFTAMHDDVKTGSPLMKRLDGDAVHYTLTCYTRLNDDVVGEALASPAGRPVLWVDTPAFGWPHAGAATDSRILADIERRLRNEPPLATEPYATLP